MLLQAKIDGAALGIPGGIVAAAKVLNEVTEESSKDLYSEAAISAQLGDHPHVVSQSVLGSAYRLLAQAEAGAPVCAVNDVRPCCLRLQVGLLGVVTAGYPAMLLVSFCEHGSLLSQLLRRAGLDPFSTQAKLKMVLEVCKGMEYLASKHIIHHLAARNILIDVEWQARIADFGMVPLLLGSSLCTSVINSSLGFTTWIHSA